MKNLILVLVANAVLTLNAFSQNIIVDRNGNEINANHVEVFKTQIEYSTLNGMDTAYYAMSLNDVFMIKHEDGTKTIVTQEEKEDLSDEKISFSGKYFFYKNVPMKGKQVKRFLAQSNDSIIHGYLMKAKAKKTAGVVLIVTGSFFPNLIVGTGLLTTGICMMNTRKQYRNASLRYNELIDREQQNKSNSNVTVSVTK